jgi:hypothetical protein
MLLSGTKPGSPSTKAVLSSLVPALQDFRSREPVARRCSFKNHPSQYWSAECTPFQPAQGWALFSSQNILCVSVLFQVSVICAPAQISGMLKPFAHWLPETERAASCLLPSACLTPFSSEYMPLVGCPLDAYLHLYGESLLRL